MSNETSSSNSPPHKRARHFCLSSYLTSNQIAICLDKKQSQCKAYAYICHDRDVDIETGELKQAHHHILISTVNGKTVEQVRNWFKGFTDDKGQPVNTLGQIMYDVSGSWEYLTHNTDIARAEGKYFYPDTDIKGYNLDLFKNNTLDDCDNMSLALEDMLNGVPLREIAKRYGRDFIIHYASVRALYNDITGRGCNI